MNLHPTVAEIAATVQTLPLIDSDVAEVITLLNDPESNYNQVAMKLSPGLAARFLEIVNADPARRAVRSIHLAVKLLGYRKMRDALVTAIAVDHFTSRLNNFNFEKFLHQARFCAAVARILGEIFDFTDQADLFTVATLQNIGKLVIAVYFKDHHEAIVALKRSEGIPTSFAESRIFGLTHAEIGALVLRRYRIPEEICEAVRTHDQHVPLDGSAALSELQVITRAAAAIVGRFQLPTDFDAEDLPLHLHRTIAAGKRLRHRLAQPHILSGGYESVFPQLVTDLSNLVMNDLHRLLPVRRGN